MSSSEMFSTNKKKVSRRLQQIYHDRAKAPSSLQFFDFLNLPTELAIDILVLAIASSSYWRTYRSLIRVSHAFRALVYRACFPHLPVMLHTLRHYESFSSLLATHPNTVGPHVRYVWFIASVKSSVERTMGLDILQKCPQLTHMACNINLLQAFLGSPNPLAHDRLADLTLVANTIPWDDLLSQPTGRQLFAQLVHLRVSTENRFAAPSFCFASLTHISYTHDRLDFDEMHDHPCADPAGFPVLQQIVPTIPYKTWRTADPKQLRIAAIMVDPRFDVLACPKKWKEADVWEEARRGEKDLWTRAQSKEYLEKSRAVFTQGPGRPYRRRHWDDYDDEFDDWFNERMSD